MKGAGTVVDRERGEGRWALANRTGKEMERPPIFPLQGKKRALPIVERGGGNRAFSLKSQLLGVSLSNLLKRGKNS